MELEHRHLNFNEGWTSRISTYWEGEVEDIPWETLKQYVFDPLNSGDVLQTETYDANSIMIWPFSARYASNTARERNYDLSAKDIEFIGSLYPAVESNVAIVMRKDTDGGHFWFKLRTNSSGVVKVDWGDGTIENFTLESLEWDNKQYLAQGGHDYASGSDHIIKVYTNPLSINSFTSTSNAYISQLDVSKCTNLENFVMGKNTFVYLDLSKNTKLRYLNYVEGILTHLDFTNNPLLEEIWVTGTQVTSMNVSNNKALKILWSNNNPINQLDITKNILLEELYIEKNAISILDTSKNPRLIEIDSRNSPISQLDITKNVLLEFLIINDTFISKLNASQNTKLSTVAIGNTPLERNISELTNFANSLPYATPYEGFLGLKENADRIATILVSKNWTYGY